MRHRIWVITGSDNGLAPFRCQSVVSTNGELLPIRPQGTDRIKFCLKFKSFHSRKCIWTCRLQNDGHYVSASLCWRRRRWNEASPVGMRKNIGETREEHDDVIKWKYFPRYWPFVRGTHRWPVNSPRKGQWRKALMFSLICAWTNVLFLSKHSWGWWFETPLRPLWRHCNETFTKQSTPSLRTSLHLAWFIVLTHCLLGDLS